MDLERLAYESALGALEQQERVLDELRARTGVLLAASSVATSFLGSRAVGTGGSVVVVTALLAFALLVATSVFVLVPRRNAFTFALSGPDVYEGLFAFRGDPSEIYRRLAYDLHRFWGANDSRIQPLFGAFQVACAALVVEITLLLTSVSGTVVQ
jgi:hypothetical protein